MWYENTREIHHYTQPTQNTDMCISLLKNRKLTGTCGYYVAPMIFEKKCAASLEQLSTRYTSKLYQIQYLVYSFYFKGRQQFFTKKWGWCLNVKIVGSLVGVIESSPRYAN